MTENNTLKKKPRYIENNRGNKQLIDDQNFLYHVDQRRGNRTWWVCTEKRKLNCKATAAVVQFESNGIETEYATFFGDHSHLSNLAKVQAQIMDRQTIAEAKMNLSAPPSKILADSTNKHKNDSTTTSVLLHRRKSASIIRSMQIQRAKVKDHSSVPQSMAAIAISPLPEKYMVTEMGDQFLLVKDNVEEDDQNKCFLCFMSPLQKELGRLAKKWFCDGTFKTCPYPFSGKGSKGQVYTLFAELDTGVVIPFAFCLLPDKLAVTYCRMWSAVHQALTNDGQILLRLECVGMDFEVAPRSEFEALFPGVLVVGCFFHWRQAVNRNLATKGCTRFFNENLHFQDIVAMCIGLAFVPLDQIIEFTMLIEQEWDKFEEEMCDEAADWITYFMRTYVGEINARTGRRKSPMFAHQTWSKYREILAGESTTSNRAEAWNRAYGIRSDTNPSFWGCLDSFVREEALAVRKFREETVGVRSQPPAPYEGTSRQIHQRDKDARLKNLVQKATSLPKSEYLGMLSALIRGMP